MQKLSVEMAKRLSSEYGDAFYLLDSEQFMKNYYDLSNAFKKYYSHFNIAYSYKTNYTPKFCRLINDLGGYAEVVSDMELEIALRSGVLYHRIIWNGPIKNLENEKAFLLQGGTANIDSMGEMLEIARFAETTDRALNIGVRCNFDVGDGVISRFGFDSESDDFYDALNIIKKTRNLKLINLQCHFAKRSVEYWPARVKGMVRIVNKVATIIGYVPERIDIGGGLYGNMDDSLKKQFNARIPSFDEYAMAAATVFAEAFPHEKPELLIEPGSAMVGDCMKFVSQVKTIKTVRGKTFITVLGSQKNISMSGVNPPLEVVPSGDERKEYSNADIVGYTCIEGDVLFHGYNGKIAIGDYIVISNCGSYSIVMKPPFILPNFPVIDICGNQIDVIKRQETFDDLFKTYIF